MQKRKEIKTDYKVAVIANQLVKDLNKSLRHFKSSNYQAWQRKTYSNDRYVYVTCESSPSITETALNIIMTNVKVLEEQYELGRVISGVDLIEREKDGVKGQALAYFVLISKKPTLK